MEGGDFCANVDGLQHYKHFGYKGKLQSKEEFDLDFSLSRSWIRVPYKYNRGIFHDGNFPHLSTRISSIRPGIRRVILGFNCFPIELAECNARAPEHSDAFNRTIKLYQTLAAAGLPITSSTDDDGSSSSSSSSSSGTDGTEENLTIGDLANTKKKVSGINIRDLVKNPMLARLIVTAAKKVAQTAEREEVAKKAASTNS
jgi:hypothetical protein